MRLPERLHDRSFAEWNYLVRGVVEIWELARLLGVEHALEQRLASDDDCRFVERIGRLGNDCAALGRLSWLYSLHSGLAGVLPESVPGARTTGPADDMGPAHPAAASWRCLRQVYAELVP